MSKSTNGIQSEAFAWDVAGGLPLLLYDGAYSYLTGPGGLPVESVSSTGALNFYHADQLGSTRLITDAGRASVISYDYDAYGNVSASTGVSDNPFQFAGQYVDWESELYYLRARYYDPATGQFVSRDPVRVTTRQPYSYVSDNPLNGSDPRGLWGLGISLPSASFEAGLGQIGAAFTGQFLNVGLFGTTGGHISVGASQSAGAFAGTATAGPAYPGCGSATSSGDFHSVVGAYAGAGPSGFITNAQNISETGGPFTTISFNAGFIDRVASIQLSVGSNGTWVLALGGGPLPGPGFGLSASVYNTTTNDIYNQPGS